MVAVLESELLAACRGMTRVRSLATSPSEIAQLAYLAVYACGYGGRGSLDGFRRPNYSLIDSRFAARVRTAVPDTVFDHGWIVTDVGNGDVRLTRLGIRTVAPSSLVIGGSEPGSTVAVRMPAVSAGRVPGFLSRSGSLSIAGKEISRIYLNLAARHVVWALGCLARRLDTAGIPFDIKAAGHPRSYRRRDACVLYVPSTSFRESSELVLDSMAANVITLRDEIPLLTERIGQGVGFAEDPSDVEPVGQSHGQWVSSLLLSASAVHEAPRLMAAEIRKEIASIGRDPDRPHLRGA